MKFKKELHLALLVIYAAVVNFKVNPNYIDGIIIVSILLSMLLQAYFDHNTLPDIRKEVEAQINAFKAELEGKISNTSKETSEKLDKLEKDNTELKNSIAPLVGTRTIGMSNASIRF